MEPNNPSRFFLYILFAAFNLGILFALDAFLMLHHTEEASRSSKPTKAYIDKKKPKGTTEESGSEMKAESKEQTAEIQPVTTERIPNFKEQRKIQPLAKTLVTQFSEEEATPVVEEQSAFGKNEPIEDPKTEPVKKEIVASISNGDYFKELQNDYKRRVLDKLGTEPIRRDIIIRYYKHPLDGNAVYELRKLAYYIHERPIDESLMAYESNSVFYGDNVSSDDLKLVVYKLLQQGMPIKNIALSQFHDGWKASSIEIGTDTTVTSQSVITIEELQGMSF